MINSFLFSCKEKESGDLFFPLKEKPEPIINVIVVIIMSILKVYLKPLLSQRLHLIISTVLFSRSVNIRCNLFFFFINIIYADR